MTGLGRLSRTLMHLRPAQIGQRARLRAQQAGLDRSLPLAAWWLLSGSGLGAAGDGWPVALTPLDARLWGDGQDGKALRIGEFRLIGVSRAIAGADEAGNPRWEHADWEAAGAPLLWRFHLYFWDWAWALAGESLGLDGPEIFAAIWRSWHGAVIPGRGPAWHPYALRAWSFRGIYRLVHGAPIERLLLGELAAHAGFLRRSLETDVGGNHLIKNLKALAGLAVFLADESALASALRRLLRQLAVQVLPDGGHYERVPTYHCQVLGDVIDVAGLLRTAGREVLAAMAEEISAMQRWLAVVLAPAGDVPLINDGFPVSRDLLAQLVPAAPAASGALGLLPDTGFARAMAGGRHVLADVGPSCPRDLPAHAHAGTVTVEAAHDGYRSVRGRPRHRRRWTLCARELRVDDTVTGQGRHHIAVRWHLVPDTRLRLVPGGAVGAPVLACTAHLRLPVRISTVWRRSEPRQEST